MKWSDSAAKTLKLTSLNKINFLQVQKVSPVLSEHLEAFADNLILVKISSLQVGVPLAVLTHTLKVLSVA